MWNDTPWQFTRWYNKVPQSRLWDSVGKHIRVVHSSHSWAIFGSFLSIWQRNKQKVAKNGMQNDVKNVYHEHSGKENLEKWWENAFFSPGTVPKRWKMIIFQFTFCKIEVRVPFWVPFCQKINIFISISFDSEFHFRVKCNENELKNEVKNGWKSQLWTTLLQAKSCHELALRIKMRK